MTILNVDETRQSTTSKERRSIVENAHPNAVRFRLFFNFEV